jgi:hypothetical protein
MLAQMGITDAHNLCSKCLRDLRGKGMVPMSVKKLQSAAGCHPVICSKISHGTECKCPYSYRLDSSRGREWAQALGLATVLLPWSEPDRAVTIGMVHFDGMNLYVYLDHSPLCSLHHGHCHRPWIGIKVDDASTHAGTQHSTT